jgi:hypothetical protein
MVTAPPGCAFVDTFFEPQVDLVHVSAELGRHAVVDSR